MLKVDQYSFTFQKRVANHSCPLFSVDEYEGEILKLTQISRFDSGVYLCIAKNGVPPSVSKRVRLYVDFPPTLWISHQLVGVQLGQVGVETSVEDGVCS